jgi:iron(III) transport system permease protein
VSELVTDLPGTPITATRSRLLPGRRRPPLAIALAGLAAAVVAVGPIWYLVDRASERGWSETADELWQDRTLELALRSITLAATVTLACVLIGTTAAWIVVRSDLRGRGVLRVLFALPLAIPSYLSAFAWVSWKRDLPGFWGAVLVLTLVSYPFVYLPCVAALRHLDPAQEEVARSLGRSPLRIAVGLTLRQIRTSITAGALLVALYVLSDFGAVAAMRYEVFTWVIYGAYRAGFNPTRAAVLALPLVAIALVLVTAEARARGRAASARLGAGASRRATQVHLGWTAVLAWLFSLAVLGAAVGFPVWRVLFWVTSYSSPEVDIGDVVSSLGSTLWLAGWAAGATLLFAIPVGILAARFRGPAASTIERSTYIAHALPGIVVAISLVYIGVRVLRPIYLETPLLVLGYVVLFLPLAVGAVRSSIEQSPVRLEEVARSLGSTPRQVLMRVTAPLALPGIAAGAALVFLSTMKELPVTLVLHPTGTDTLATTLWRYTAVSDYANAGPYALALVLFAAIPTALLSGVLFVHRDRHS